MTKDEQIKVAVKALERAQSAGRVPWLYEFQAKAAAEAVVEALRSAEASVTVFGDQQT